MSHVYRIDLISLAGNKFAEISDFQQFSCYKKVNAPGLLSAVLDGDLDDLADPLFVDKCGVELWWKDDDLGLEWNRFFSGLYRKRLAQMLPQHRFQLDAPGDLHRLSWRIVNWAAGTVNRSYFSAKPGETIMKTMVNYNAGALATVANGRKREGAIPGISVQSDGAAGSSVDWYCFGDNLLESLQKLFPLANGDFDLYKLTGATWEFRWYTGQLGTDRTADVKFSYEQGNLTEPQYNEDHNGEATVACVWGRGEDASRDYTTRLSADYAVGNDIEVYVDARNVTLGASTGLESEGDKKLQETQAKKEFKFKVKQIESCALNQHYFVGDLVTLRNTFTGLDSTQKVVGATIGEAPNGTQTIDIELAAP